MLHHETSPSLQPHDPFAETLSSCLLLLSLLPHLCAHWFSFIPLCYSLLEIKSFEKAALYPILFILHISVYQFFGCSLPPYHLPGHSYLPPSSLLFLLLLLSPCLPVLLPPLTPCPQTLCLSHTHTHHQQLPPRPSLAEDVYFMPLSHRGLMTFNCFICLMSSGARERLSSARVELDLLAEIRVRQRRNRFRRAFSMEFRWKTGV